MDDSQFAASEGVRPARYPCSIYFEDSKEPGKVVRINGTFSEVRRCPICRSEINGYRDNFCWNCGVKFIREERKK